MKSRIHPRRAEQAGHEVFLRTFEMRWPFKEQDYARKMVEQSVRDGMTLGEAQHKFGEQVLASIGKLPREDS